MSNWWNKLTLFQKIFLIFFFAVSIASFFLPLLTGSKFSQLFDLLSIIGLITALAGVVTSIYQARGEVTMYVFLITNTVGYAYLSAATSFWGQVFQNMILLLPLQIVGLFVWKRNTAERKAKSTDESANHVEVKKLTAMQWLYLVFGFFVAWFIYYGFTLGFPAVTKHFGLVVSPDPQAALDSLTTVITVTAMVLMSLRFFEQWYFWILSNFGVVLFIIQLFKVKHYTAGTIVGDLDGAISWLQYGVGSIYGLYLWNKFHKEQKAQELSKI